MRIGIPTEIKNNENRVAMTPAGAVHLVQNGHEVFVQKGAGLGSGFTDEEYVQAGAKLVETAEEAWNQDMVMKVKEPVASEYGYFREGLILFTYLHLAPEPELTKALIDNKVASIAYETVQLDNRSLPLLAPMSEVAGRMSAQIGAQFLEKNKGGKGILLAGVPGVKRGKVTIIGGGQAGTNAAKIAVGLGADVTIIDLSAERLRQLDDIFGNQVKTLMSNPYNIAEAVKESDLVIGAVLIPGAKAPKLVTEEMIQSMEPGSVVVDIAIDQGGIFETTDRITTHDNPTYEKHGVVHYAVANMPGAVPRTSTLALTNVTVPYAVQIANKGYKDACLGNTALLKGINTLDGYVTFEAVAEAHGLQYADAKELLEKAPALS
ncbi:TPA: alanine dehydrogenase [Bacillus thuringiensis]|jgi:alanine dehydrogenase|uniref:Alanine dehydrogenase n=13 Tax=Bacillus cereus group TaxID=86661 RepID=A0A9X5AC97_BACTU|nr:MULTISPECIES: alanine dehydrogenase [Bacillus]ANN34416.1 alanine dehydrogenase [Bacillus thuringiensis serovar coreanensis]EEK76742.1 Alanine dehydrogenase [Bacillus cereus R309803]EEM39559.1 Alanine dehydrogenase [Bacillus thuringiensis serovar sotto str. T04001]MDM5372474.1 alanine dehydrogenase [Bacillus bombysepticus]NIE90460.1 alanine dehydrogenase [Bacillus sp. Ab-1751]OUB34040.1 alanine dehydrogenase [Bacillus thuringiensis serovar yunnanensis]QQP79045.1 alanine dehydrogenase [Baci